MLERLYTPLERLYIAVEKNDEDRVSTILNALQIGYDKYDITLTIPRDVRLLRSGVTLFPYALANNFSIFKKLIFFLKHNSARKEFTYYQESLTYNLYKTIFLQNLPGLSLLVEDAEVSLLNPSIGFHSHFESVLIAADDNLDIFRYLLPHFIHECQMTNKDEKEILKFTKEKITTNLTYTEENSIQRDTLAIELKIIESYEIISNIFENHKIASIYKLSFAYEIDPFYCIQFIGYFLETISADSNKKDFLDERYLSWLIKLIKTVYSLIADEEEVTKENIHKKEKLIESFHQNILPRYLTILSFYQYYKKSTINYDATKDKIYISAKKFLAKNDLILPCSYEMMGKKDQVDNRNIQDDMEKPSTGSTEQSVTEAPNQLERVASPISLGVLEELILLLCDCNKHQDAMYLFLSPDENEKENTLALLKKFIDTHLGLLTTQNLHELLFVLSELEKKLKIDFLQYFEKNETLFLILANAICEGELFVKNISRAANAYLLYLNYGRHDMLPKLIDIVELNDPSVIDIPAKIVKYIFNVRQNERNDQLSFNDKINLWHKGLQILEIGLKQSCPDCVVLLKNLYLNFKSVQNAELYPIQKKLSELSSIFLNISETKDNKDKQKGKRETSSEILEKLISLKSLLVGWLSIATKQYNDHPQKFLDAFKKFHFLSEGNLQQRRLEIFNSINFISQITNYLTNILNNDYDHQRINLILPDGNTIYLGVYQLNDVFSAIDVYLTAYSHSKNESLNSLKTILSESIPNYEPVSRLGGI